MIFYNFGVRLLGLIMQIAALFHDKAAKWVAGRKHWKSALPTIDGKEVVWFHCASLGEFEQGRPIIEAWRERRPNDYIVLTFFSPSGYAVRKDYDQVDYCCYLPLDTPANARYFVNHFQPRKVFFVKYEFWLNYIHASADSGASIYSLSAIFRPEQRFFKWHGRIFRNALQRFELFFVQNESSKNLLNGIGIDQVVVSGDTRYDRVNDRVLDNQKNSLLSSWLMEEKAFVIGSSWLEDENVVADAIRINFPKRLIIAPHEIGESTVRRLEGLFKEKVIRYTDAQKLGEIPHDARVVILDCIGVLASAYANGSFAYVGGAFKSGLHNILEPAAFGLPVIFGPKYEKFPEAQEFIDAGIGFSIADAESFGVRYNKLLTNYASLSSKVVSFMKNKTGARDIILETIL